MKFVESFLFITITAASVFSTTASPCQSNNDCPATQLCENGECFDPCSGYNESFIGNCTVINHEPIFECPEGYETRPNVLGCIDETIVSCQTNNDCPSTDQCIDDECIDACWEFDGTIIGNCTVINHEPIVECPEGYETLPNVLGCIDETICQTNNDCPSTDRCIDDECVDACWEFNESPYKYYGYCRGKYHQPQILCHSGYYNPPCSLKCVILQTGSKYYGESCSRSIECQHQFVCTDGKCSNPCNDWPEEVKSFCAIRNHVIMDRRCGAKLLDAHG